MTIEIFTFSGQRLFWKFIFSQKISHSVKEVKSYLNKVKCCPFPFLPIYRYLPLVNSYLCLCFHLFFSLCTQFLRNLVLDLFSSSIFFHFLIYYFLLFFYKCIHSFFTIFCSFYLPEINAQFIPFCYFFFINIRWGGQILTQIDVCRIYLHVHVYLYTCLHL